MVRSRQKEELFHEVCKAAVHHGGFLMAWIGWHDVASRLIVPVAQCGDEFNYLEGIIVASDDRPEGRGPAGTAFRTGRTCIFSDFASNPATVVWHHRANRIGIQASGSFPIRSQGDVRGVLTIYAAETDYFQAEEIELLERTADDISFALDNFEIENQRRSAEVLARRLTAIVESTNDAIISKTLDGEITSWNPAAERMFGHGADEAIGQNISIVIPEDRLVEEPEFIRQLAAGQSIIDFETIRVRKDGQIFPVSITVSPLRNEAGMVIGASKIVRDTTERKALKAQLVQAQKMEAIGHLTGGIAHDFNNLLTVVLGCSEILSGELSDNPELVTLSEMIHSAAKRGAELTHQMLAFGRRQMLQPTALHMEKLLTDLGELLKRTLSDAIEVEIINDPDAWMALVDPVQVESAILNLALNAKDAMPHGGRLTIETTNVWLDDSYSEVNIEVVPGPYVAIIVSDNGVGISSENIGRVFDPFFSTKPSGKGSGLGLSMVYGFVKQSLGHVKIYSEVGVGTSVKLYLPRADCSDALPVQAELAANDPSGTEKILLVEDDPLVLAFAERQLTNLGFKVVTAKNGIEALQVVGDHMDIDLLFTDVVMPGGLNGRQLAEEVSKIRPGIKILLSSGYTEDVINHQGRLAAGMHLLGKPYSRIQLASAIRGL